MEQLLIKSAGFLLLIVLGFAGKKRWSVSVGRQICIEQGYAVYYYALPVYQFF